MKRILTRITITLITMLVRLYRWLTDDFVPAEISPEAMQAICHGLANPKWNANKYHMIYHDENGAYLTWDQIQDIQNEAVEWEQTREDRKQASIERQSKGMPF